jgi:hypothetical protein
MEKASKGGALMQGRTNRRWRRCRLLAAVAVTLACDRPDYTYQPDLPINDGSGVAVGGFGGTGFGTAGSFTTGASGAAPPAGECLLDRSVSTPTFSKQTVNNQVPARRVVYLQMTDEEVERLKASGSLLPQPTQPPQRTTLTSLLTELQSTASEVRKPLLQELLKRFQVTRAAWPNLWALRLVEHPSSQRMNPVRLTLKEDAWIVRISDGTPAILDVNNAIVSITAATAEPERIAAVYYVTDDRSPGSIASCESGKRELALGNPSMVEQFAIGTPEILAQLDTDIAALEAFFGVVRPCGSVDRNGMTFQAFTVCQSWRFFDTSTEFLAYQWSLTQPVEAYKPTSQNLATLIQALKDDRFEPEPFIGTPRTSTGAGGEGGAGGAGGEGGVGGEGVGGEGVGGEGGAGVGGAGGP